MTVRQVARSAAPGRRSATIARGRRRATVADEATRQLVHDIRSRSAAIRMLAEVLATQLSGTEPAARLLSQIRIEATGIADICDDGLTAERGEVLALPDVVDEVVHRAESLGHTEVRCQARAAQVRACPSTLRRVLVNLVDNACRAAGDGGWVEVAVDTEDDRAVLSVADSGPGPGPWADALLSGVPAPEGALHGHGLGSARRLIEQLSGTVAVGHHDAGGSVVTVWLPLAGSESTNAYTGSAGPCSSSATTT